MAKMNTQSILKVVVVAVLLGMACTSYAAEDTWTRKADMPTARMVLSTSVVDGKIYAIGGAQDLYVGPLATVEQYDPATDSWTKKADMPGARYTHSAAVVSAKIYVIGGSTAPRTAVATVQEYDPATDTWTNKANMPTARAWLSACVVSRKIYAIGGRIYPEGLNVSTVEEYDPATDTWTKKADMPAPRVCFSTSVVNGKIYAIGGGWEVGLSTVEEYDPATDTWTKKADMPTARKALSTSVVNGKIYAIGGGTGTGGPVFSAVEEYDPATDTWTNKADMPTARWAHSTSVVNAKIYAIGGDPTGSRRSATSTVEEYDTGLGLPSPDFNGDEIVNFKDFSTLAQYLHQDQSPYVCHRLDYEDLAVLADYWLKEVLPVSLIAYWKLDETEGGIAHDSIAGNDAFGPPDLLWRPEDGKVGGALELDGIDDLLFTTFSLNPAGTSFSAFAWVKGGAPGQVIISQSGGANWLSADPADGTLMTELRSSGRFGGPLYSQTVIIDGDWHRVGLTWDGSYRILYVDDVEVAGDTQAGLAGSNGGLYFGAGENPVPASLWLGLLDDIRIYDRVVAP
jgi:N-acetylneuraminic acid mutarotase